MNLDIPEVVPMQLSGSVIDIVRPGKNIAIIYDRLNYLTLGSIISLVKLHVDKVYVVDGQDSRISYIAKTLGAGTISLAGPEKGSWMGEVLTSGGACVFLYGDGTHIPEKIPALLGSITAGYDVAIGLSTARTHISESVRYLTNQRSKADFSGFLACSSKCLEGHSFDCTSSGSPMGPVKEIFNNAKSKNLKIKQIGLGDENLETLSLYRIGVVVPAYNEERLIRQTIEGIPAYMDRIYVVDDCSKDNTPGVIDSLKDPRVVNIRHEVNKGVGAAIITGYKKGLEEEMDIIAVMAGDNQMDPEQLPRLLMPIIEGKADYTKGNRLLSKDMRKGMSNWRSLGNLMLTMITKIGSGYWHISDPQNGYTAISRQALESMDLGMVYTYYGYCNDLLIKLNAFGMRTVDVVMPARYGDEKSKIKYSRFIMKVAPMIFRGFLWRLKTKYVVLDFNTLVLFYFASMVMIPVGVILGILMLLQGLMGRAVPSSLALSTLVITLWGVQFLLFAMMLDVQENKGSIQVNTNL